MEQIYRVTHRIVSRNRLAFSLLFLLSVLLYLNSYQNQFVHDDLSIITANRIVRGEAVQYKEIFQSSYWDHTGEDKQKKNRSLYRPLTILSYSLNYQYAKDDPAPYHLINILLNALNVVLLYYAFSLLFPYRKSLVYLASLVFALHPIHTEVVNPIFGRAELLALFFGLLFLIFQVKRRPIWACLFLLAAVLSKESGIVIVAVPVLLDFLFKGRRDWLDKYFWFRRYYLVFLSILLYLLIRYLILENVASVRVVSGERLANPLITAVFQARVATAFKILLDYLFLLFCPWQLSIDYSYNQIPIENSILNLAPLAGLLLVLGIVGLALKIRKQAPYLAFGILFFLAALSLVSNIPFAIGTIKAERLLYTPSIGFSFFLPVLFLTVARNRLLKGLFGLVFLAILVAFGLRTYSRNWDWYDNYTIFKAAYAVSPHSVIVCNNLAYSYYAEPEHKDYPKAIQLYLRSAAIEEKLGTPYISLAGVYLAVGQTKLADAATKKSVALYPDDFRAAKVRATYLYQFELDYEGAKPYIVKSLKLNPEQPDLRGWLDSINGRLLQYERQLRKGDKALKANRFKRAETCFIEARDQGLRRVEPYLLLAEIYYQKRQYQKALQELIDGLKLQKDPRLEKLLIKVKSKNPAEKEGEVKKSL